MVRQRALTTPCPLCEGVGFLSDDKDAGGDECFHGEGLQVFVPDDEDDNPSTLAPMSCSSDEQYTFLHCDGLRSLRQRPEFQGGATDPGQTQPRLYEGTDIRCCWGKGNSQ